MADNYQLVASQSSIQVLSADAIQDVVIATIQTNPSKVIASAYVPKLMWDAGNAPGLLNDYASNIETIMDVSYVLAASPGQTLDASGLLQAELTFTIGYTPPGSNFPPATVDVPIAADRLYATGGPITAVVPGVLADLNDAYNNLILAAGGTPPASTPPPPAPAPAPAPGPGPTTSPTSPTPAPSPSPTV